MSTRRLPHGRISFVLALLLVASHLFDFRGAVDGLILGVVPWDLGYHLLWFLVAFVFVLHLTTFVWPDPADDPLDSRRAPQRADPDGTGRR